MTDQDLAEFREKLQSCERSASGHPPRDLRVRGAKLVVQMLEAGETVAAVAKALGLTAPTVKQWGSTALEKRPVTPMTLVPVEVVPERHQRTSKPTSSERRLSVTAPSGYRVDGLSVAEAAALLRALR